MSKAVEEDGAFNQIQYLYLPKLIALEINWRDKESNPKFCSIFTLVFFCFNLLF